MQLTGIIEISIVKDVKDIPFHLLLLADPSRSNVEKYIPESDVYKAELNGAIVGCYVLCKLDKDTVEIKNIAVMEQLQGQGLGTRLLLDAIERSKNSAYKKIIIGTGNSSLGQLYLYQKVGFRITQIIPDFFVKNYENEIWENGLPCKDMIVLTKEI